MNKFILFFLFLLGFIGVNAQAPVIINQPYDFRSWVKVKKAFNFPTGCGVPSGTASLNGADRKMSAIYRDSCGKKTYIFEPSDSTWSEIGSGGTSLEVVTPEQFGADNTGVIDATTALQNMFSSIIGTPKLVYMGPGTFKTTGNIHVPSCRIVGVSGTNAMGFDGPQGNRANQYDGTKILCSSTTNNLFIFDSSGTIIENCALINTSGSTPTAGAGIKSMKPSTKILHCAVSGFYDNVWIDESPEYLIDDVFFSRYVRYGLFHRTLIEPDAGDQVITSCWFYPRNFNSNAGVHIESGGGIKINDLKFNANSVDTLGKNCIEIIVDNLTTSDLLINNCSFENYSGDGLYIKAVNSGAFLHTVLTGNQFAALSPTGTGIRLDGTGGTVEDITITGNQFAACDTGIVMLGVTKPSLVGNLFNSMTSLDIYSPTLSEFVQLNYYDKVSENPTPLNIQLSNNAPLYNRIKNNSNTGSPTAGYRAYNNSNEYIEIGVGASSFNNSSGFFRTSATGSSISLSPALTEAIWTNKDTVRVSAPFGVLLRNGNETSSIQNIQGSFQVSANAHYNGTTWERFNTSLPSWNLNVDPNTNAVAFRQVAAGVGSITWSTPFKVGSFIYPVFGDTAQVVVKSPYSGNGFQQQYSFMTVDNLDRPITQIDNSGRQNLYDYSGQGAVHVLYNRTVSGFLAGHYAFGSYNNAGSMNTINTIAGFQDVSTAATVDSRLEFGYMDAANTTGGYTQPNKKMNLSKAGLALPDIPFNGATIVKFSGTTLSDWSTSPRAGLVQAGGSSVLFGTSSDFNLNSNAYYSPAGWRYYSNGKASNQLLFDGEIWHRAASTGTADALLTYVMPLKSSYLSGGSVGIGGDISTISGSLAGASLIASPSVVNISVQTKATTTPGYFNGTIDATAKSAFDLVFGIIGRDSSTSSTGGNGVRGISVKGTGVFGDGVYGVEGYTLGAATTHKSAGIRGISDNNITAPAIVGTVNGLFASPNDTLPVLDLYRITRTGTQTAGGSKIRFFSPRLSGGLMYDSTLANTINSVINNINGASYTTELYFTGRKDSAENKIVAFKGDGQIQLPKYDGTNFNTTNDYLSLVVDPATGNAYSKTLTLKGSTTWDPASVGANSSVSTTLTVTGAALGDGVIVSKTSGSFSNGELYFAYVSATNTVTIQLQNVSGATFDIASATFNVIVHKF